MIADAIGACLGDDRHAAVVKGIEYGGAVGAEKSAPMARPGPSGGLKKRRCRAAAIFENIQDFENVRLHCQAV